MSFFPHVLPLPLRTRRVETTRAVACFLPGKEGIRESTRSRTGGRDLAVSTISSRHSGILAGSCWDEETREAPLKLRGLAAEGGASGGWAGLRLTGRGSTEAGPRRAARGEPGEPWSWRSRTCRRSGCRLRAQPSPPPSKQTRPGAASGCGDVSRGPRARQVRRDVAQARGGAAQERVEAMGDPEEQLLLRLAAAPGARRGGRPPHR